MNTEYTKQFIDFNEKLFNSGWLKQTTELYKTLAERQQAYAESSLKNLTSHISHLSSVKNPQEFIQSQNEFLHNHLHNGLEQLQETLLMTANHLNVIFPCCESTKAGRKTEKKTKRK